MSHVSESRVPSPESRPLPIAVLASGRGSNLAALIDARAAGRLPVNFALVAGDKADAPALRNAEAHGIPTFALDPKTFTTRREFDQALFANIAASGAQLVVLAGYMRIIDPSVIAPWSGRMINIHPSLLPKYRGLHTHRRALEAGDAKCGASVHFVSAELDGGPMIAQTCMGVRPGDTEESLAARLLPEEHRLLTAVVDAIARGHVDERGGTVRFHDRPIEAPLRLDNNGRLMAA
ncbi:MAG: phosphoribosylglycinamide formyltransferase [Rhodanobacteraceae bacterium]